MDKNLLEYMNKVADYYTKPNQYTAQDVVNMFLNQETRTEDKKVLGNGSENIQPAFNRPGQAAYHLDMDELVKWKNKNNSKYAVRSHMPITSHRKVIGKVLIFSKKIVRKCLKWYIDPVVEQQNEFNASVTASINAVYNNDIVTNQFMQDIEAQLQDMKANYEYKVEHLSEKYIQDVQELQELSNTRVAQLEELKKWNKEQEQIFASWMEDKKQEISLLQDQLKTLQEELRESNIRAEQETEKIRKELEEKLNEQQLNHTVKVDKLNEALEKSEENMSYLTYKMNKIKKEGIKVKLIEGKSEIEEKGLAVDEEVKLDYFLFENKFRGTEKSIKKNQEQYLKYYKGKENILDIGCGRGEFLELLNEHHISAQGIDVYGEFADYCKDKGLKAAKQDALSYMREQKDNSIGGIFMGQVAEHLENDYLLNLLANCHEKMEKGAYFIAETPNPTNLSTFASSFYLDPSHVKPVHPEAFKFMLEYVGFKEVEIIYTESSKSAYRLPLLNASGASNLEEFNSGINCLSDMLMGSLDYAVVAKK